MTITLERMPGRKGCSNEWECRAEAFVTGFGRTRTEAQGNFLGANLAKLGVVRQYDIDPETSMRVVVWEAKP